MAPLTLSLVDFLLTVEAQRALDELAGQDLSEQATLGLLTRLRRRWPADQAAALLDQARLRRKAGDKFPHPERLLFTDDALQQASSRVVAVYRAQQFSAALHRSPVADHQSPATIADLGCGIGADTIALAEAGLHVLAVERDPVRACIAAANVTALGLAGRVRVVCGDWLTLTPTLSQREREPSSAPPLPVSESRGESAPPLPLGEGRGEGEPPRTVSKGRGESAPPLPLGEGWGEGEPPLPLSEGQGESAPPLPLGEGRGESAPPLPLSEGRGESAPPLPLSEGRGESAPPLPLSEGRGESALPLPLGEGGGEGEPPLPLSEGRGEIAPPLPLGEGWGESAPPLPLGEGWGEGGIAAAFVDPSRRAGDQRIFRLDAMEPPLSAVLRLLDAVPMLAVKTLPGIADEDIPPGAEVEFISERGQMKEALLRFGDLCTGAARRATLLPGPHQLDSNAPLGHVPIHEPLDWLYEPDAAVIRATLVQHLATQLGAAQLDPTIAYLTARRPVETPFARCWAVQRHEPFHLKTLNRWLRECGAGAVVVKKRGSAVDPDELRRRLKITSGGPAVTVFLTRVDGRPWMALGLERSAPADPT